MIDCSKDQRYYEWVQLDESLTSFLLSVYNAARSLYEN